MPLALHRHDDRVIRDFVRLGGLRLDDEVVGAGEELALDARPQVPQHVGAVRDVDVLRLALTHERRDVQHLASALHRDARAGQRQTK